MDRRRSDYESYRPTYDSNQNARDNESNPRFQNGRPSVPSRSNSHLSHASRTFRSPNDTPSNSPHSPQASHGDSSNVGDLNQAIISKDPRKTRGPPDLSTSEKPRLNSTESTVANYFLELARQVSCEDKVREAENKLKATKRDERLMKERFSDNNPLADQYAKDRKRDEDFLSNCLQLLTDSKGRTEKALANLSPKAKDLLSGVVPSSAQASPRDESDNMKSAVRNLEEKMEALTKQNREQEMELKQLRERNIRPPSEPLEAKLTSKITASQRDVNAKFVALDERFQNHNESLRLQEKIVNQQRDDLQNQNAEIKSLTSNQVRSTGGIALLQKRVDQLEMQRTEKSLIETPRSPPRDDLEDEIAEIKAQQKEQKRQIANLSNMFVSHEEYTQGFSQLETSNKSMEKLLQSTDKAYQDLSSAIPIMVNSATQLAEDMNKIKISLKEFSATDLKALHERVDVLSRSTENLHQDIETLSKGATDQGVVQTPAHGTEALLKLQNEVNELSNLGGHYTTTYDQTQVQLKQINQQLTFGDNRMTEIKGDLQSRLESVSDICQKNQKAIDEVNVRQKAKEEEYTQSITDLRKRMNECETRSISAFAQNAAAFTDIKTLKVNIEQVSHSIQSLDTRYSAISTQKLYHSIVATIQPLVPRIHELTDQMLSAHNNIAAWEQRTNLMDGRIGLIEASKAETTIKIQALENKTRSSPVTSTGQLIAPQQDREPLQQAQSVSVQEKSELQNAITNLKNHHDDYSSQIQVLKDKLVTIEQVIRDQQRDTGDGGLSSQDLTQLYTELKQTSSEVNSKFIEELNGLRKAMRGMKSEITTLEMTLSEENKIVDRLRTDIEIMDGLQSRVQAAQTDITTHRERLTDIETGLSHVQDLKQNIDRLQTKINEKETEGNHLDKLQAELEKTKEKVKDAGMEDFGLRQRMEKIEKIIFPSQDRYVLCNNLASTITEGKVHDVFQGCIIKEIRFRGGKSPDGNRTTRYAIIWIAWSANIDVAIDGAIRLQDGNPWDGRKPTIRKIDRGQFKDIWMEQPDSVKNIVANLQGWPNNRASEVASIPVAIRGVSTNNIERSDIADDTIEVVRSSVLPTKSSADPDVTELPGSDGKDLLDKFGATRDGESSKPQISERAQSIKSSTPSTRGAAKRNAPDSGSSRPSSKRGRRG